MPYKPTSSPEDYPTRPADHNADWVWQHITDNLRDAIGEELWQALEETENRE